MPTHQELPNCFARWGRRHIYPVSLCAFNINPLILVGESTSRHVTRNRRPNIAGAVGLGAALKYLEQIDRNRLGKAQDSLVNTTAERLADMPGIKLIGNPCKRSAIISFLVENSHPNDIGTLLDQQGIALRTGHHCNMPLMDRLGIPGTVRASFSLYNDDVDGDRLISGIEKAQTFL